jgi:hypothetical protein
MSFSARSTARALCFSLLVHFLLSASPSRAEILIEPRVGFHGVFQLGRPFPLEVELTNRGRLVEGTLEVRVWKSGASKASAPYPLTYRKEIFLSAQAKKSVQFTIDPDFISRPLTIAFTSPVNNTSRELDLRRHFSPAPVMLFVSEGNAAPAFSLGASSANRLVSLSLSELPSDSRALLGVSHLILYDLSLRELSRPQILALDNWILSGGRMIILGSINYALYQEPKLSRFLPVRVTGLTKVSSLGNLEPGDRSLREVWAQASTVVEGKLLAEDRGTPLLVETGRGKGKITYLALDPGRPPLSRWEGLSRLFRNLLAPSFDGVAPPRPQWDDMVFSQLIQNPSFISTYVPAGSLLLAIVVYLLVIGLWTWLWQRKRFPARGLLIVFAAGIPALTAGGYLFFSRGGNIPDGVLLTSTVLESVADGFVEAQANVALFSTQIRHYNLQVERGWTDLAPVHSRWREREEPTVVLQDGGGSNRFQLALREWDYRLFKARFVERFPLHADFEQQGDKLIVRVNNQSPKDLTECWLAVPGRRFALGDIPRGAHWTKEFPLSLMNGQDHSGTSRSDAVNFRDLSFKDKTRDVLFHSSFFSRDGGSERWSAGAVVFVGWVKDPDRRLWVDDPRIRATDYTLFRAIVPLAGPEDA